MDEPTNDLDVETLELLEELLGDYPGTLLLVSHDRDFLDNVVTSTIVMEGDGRIGEYVGGYSDWLRQHRGQCCDGGIAGRTRCRLPALGSARRRLSRDAGDVFTRVMHPGMAAAEPARLQ
jgi:ATP-binding cassette subfamily F protein uup